MKAQHVALMIMTLAMPPAAMAMGTPPQASKLDNTQWALAELDGRAVDAKQAPTLHFQAGRVRGSDGCNQIGAGYTEGADSRLRIPSQHMTSTMMACEPAVMERAAVYVGALNATERYRMEAGRLLLIDRAGEARAVFRAQETGLAGSRWKLSSVNNGRMAVTSVLTGTEITAEFGKTGQISGQAGCNRYSGPYTADAATGRIKAGPFMSTKMHCAEPAGRMEQEGQYLQALERGETYRRSGDSLEIRSGDGALQAKFTLKPGEGGPD